MRGALGPSVGLTRSPSTVRLGLGRVGDALVRTAHALRREPIGALDAEGLRLLISQDIGLDVLVPIR